MTFEFLTVSVSSIFYFCNLQQLLGFLQQKIIQQEKKGKKKKKKKSQDVCIFECRCVIYISFLQFETGNNFIGFLETKNIQQRKD